MDMVHNRCIALAAVVWGEQHKIAVLAACLCNIYAVNALYFVLQVRVICIWSCGNICAASSTIGLECIVFSPLLFCVHLYFSVRHTQQGYLVCFVYSSRRGFV